MHCGESMAHRWELPCPFLLQRALGGSLHCPDLPSPRVASYFPRIGNSPLPYRGSAMPFPNVLGMISHSRYLVCSEANAAHHSLRDQEFGIGLSAAQSAHDLQGARALARGG